MTKNNFYNTFFKQAAFLLGCLFFYSCENDPKTIREWTQSKVMIEEATGVETLFSQSGRMKSKLSAPYMLRYTADTIYVEFPKSLHVNFFDSSGKPESHLDALYGKYFESLSKVYLKDSVVVYNVKGDTLWTPELWWDQNTQKFYTDKKVRISKAGDRIYGGEGFVANQDLTDITIKQTTGTLPVPDSMAVR